MKLYAAGFNSNSTVHISAVCANSLTALLSRTLVHLYTVLCVSLLYMYVRYFCTFALSVPVYKPYIDIPLTISIVLYFNRSENNVAIRIGDVYRAFFKYCFV